MNEIYVIEVSGWDVFGEDFRYIVDYSFTSEEDAEKWLEDNSHIFKETWVVSDSEPHEIKYYDTYILKLPIHKLTKD